MKEKFFINSYGCKIIQCCASCKFNGGPKGKETTRICKAGEGEVKPSSWCGQWQMKNGPENPKNEEPGAIDLTVAGKGGGKVKRKLYLDFVLEYEQPDNNLLRVSIKDLRKEFEKNHGSIYVNM